MNSRCSNPSHDRYCPGFGVSCHTYDYKERNVMKAVLSLTEKDIANAVVAWLAVANIQADPDTFYMQVSKADRDYESDSYYAKIDIKVNNGK